METGMAPHDNWLLLTDYASKYRISVSTLRRRIKNNQITHRLDHGRYLILDETPAPAPHHEIAFDVAPLNPAPVSPTEADLADQMNGLKLGDEPILSSATRILNELKRAYTNILQEKEEQLIQVKEEVSDLKTLVRVLESDNERLRRLTQGRMTSIESWDLE